MSMIGADPELFLRDTSTGAVVPGVGLVGGTKEDPLAMEGLSNGFAIQEDNVMVEFNIPPAANSEDFASHIGRALDYINDLIRIRYEGRYSLDIGACGRSFSAEQLSSKQAVVFGCSQDFDAHSQGDALRPPTTDSFANENGEWRFAGGHIHLSYESAVPPYVAAGLCDVYLGLSSVALDKQGPRRQLYGSAGRFRPTPYGVEYRTLSNFWIWDNEIRQSMAHRAFNVISRLQGDAGDLQRLYAEIPWYDVQDAINNEDETKAADLITYFAADLKMGDL